LAGTSAELEQPQDKSQNKKEYSCEKKNKNGRRGSVKVIIRYGIFGCGGFC
jgi:hypothetical protein